MNLRDGATIWYLILEKVRNELRSIENLEDRDEICEITYELAADVDLLLGEMNDAFELNMEEE